MSRYFVSRWFLHCAGTCLALAVWTSSQAVEYEVGGPPSGAQGNLVRDGDFEAYRPGKPGPWEFRYGHKGGNFPDVLPKWKLVLRTDAKDPARGRYAETAKDGRAAGTVIMGQRIRLPQKLPPLDFGVEFQAYCSGENRCGIVALAIYSSKVWDAMPKDPMKAHKPPPRGDVFQTTVKTQGEDQTEWGLGRGKPADVRRALQRHAGKEVVVAVSFTAWHESSKEYARFDNVWLGAPLPHVNAVDWPLYVYRGEPLVLNVDASSRDKATRFVLAYRPSGSSGEWRRVALQPVSGGLLQASIPGPSVKTDLEVWACAEGSRDESMRTEIRKMRVTRKPEHPNLFYSKAELKRMREKIEEYDWAKRIFAAIRKRADGWLTQEIKPEVISGFWWHHYNCRDCGGNLKMNGPHEHTCYHCGKVWDTDILFHVYWSAQHGGYARRARELAMVYQMTGEKKYARRAIEILNWYADHYALFPRADKGGKVVSQTLDECVWLLSMMDAADLAYAEMTPGEARHIERDLIYAGAMYVRKYRGGIHNIRCWHNSAWAGAGYFLGDPELIDYARNDRHGFVAQMKEGVLDDGMWYERSMGYHDYTVMAISYHLRAAMHNGDPLHEMPEVRKLLTFPIRVTFPNMVAPSLNDGGYQARAITPQWPELAAAWYKDPVAASALRKLFAMGLRRNGMEAFQFGEELPEGAEFTPPPSADLKGAGLVVLRRGSGSDAICAMVEYGEHGGGHGHPDKLQLILYGLGQPLCPDLGTTGYANPLHADYYKRTPAHNTVTIGGKDMAAKGGKLLDFVVHPDYAAMSAQTDEIYPGYVLTRRAVLGKSYLVDEFTVAGSESNTLDWFLRAGGKLALSVDARPISEKPLSKPYGYLKELKGGAASGEWTATWTFGKPKSPGDIPRLVVTMQAAPGTQVAQCRAPGRARRAEHWDTLRVRRNAASTRFVAVHQIVPAKETVADVRFEDNIVRVGDASIDLGGALTKAPVLR